LNKDILLHEIYFDISGFYCNMFLRSMPGCGALEAFSTNRFLLMTHTPTFFLPLLSTAGNMRL